MLIESVFESLRVEFPAAWGDTSFPSKGSSGPVFSGNLFDGCLIPAKNMLGQAPAFRHDRYLAACREDIIASDDNFRQVKNRIL
jgi:hypothetical protein